MLTESGKNIIMRWEVWTGVSVELTPRIESLLNTAQKHATVPEMLQIIKPMASKANFEQALVSLLGEYGVVVTLQDEIVQGEIRHAKLGMIKSFIENNIHVFLVGEAGTGKSMIAQAVARDLGLKFYFANSITQEFKLTGYMDAMGKYHRTQFREAFENGGLFFLDELDASIPDTLVILNEALANGIFAFPDKFVEMHPDFRVISAGNTYGLGASHVYIGRNQLDGASLDRFVVVEVEYDPRIEYRLSGHDDELVAFVREFRRACHDLGVQHIVSYRAITNMAKMKGKLPDKTVVKTCLTKNLQADTIKRIKDKIGKTGGRWNESL